MKPEVQPANLVALVADRDIQETLTGLFSAQKCLASGGSRFRYPGILDATADVGRTLPISPAVLTFVPPRPRGLRSDGLQQPIVPRGDRGWRRVAAFPEWVGIADPRTPEVRRPAKHDFRVGHRADRQRVARSAGDHEIDVHQKYFDTNRQEVTDGPSSSLWKTRLPILREVRVAAWEVRAGGRIV